MKHLVLLGDSIFDNASYVPGETPVVEQVRVALGALWKVTLQAVDGDVTTDVATRLDKLPEDTTHAIVSVGGNDALQCSDILQRKTENAAMVFLELAQIQELFRTNYRNMLEAVVARERPTAVCTIYDQVPFPDPQLARMTTAALVIFNDGIVREARRLGVPVLDLRTVCCESDDFSLLSPIEPSCNGGAKIAQAIACLLREHDFASEHTVLYG